MRYSTAMIVAAMGIAETVASPAHGHLHQQAHQKKDVDWNALDWDAMGINWASAYDAGKASKTAAASAPAATSNAATPTSTGPTVSGVASSIESGIASGIDSIEALFDGLIGASNHRTSFGSSSGTSGSAGDSYVGNYGSPYGSNIMKVDSASGHDFTATFTNPQSKSITVNIWNKVGPDFQPLSGSALAPKNTTLTFALAAGGSQTVAFMPNSQVAWAEACSETAESGAFATTWGEANFLTAGSGYDVSAIMNTAGNNYAMSISSSEAPACTSDKTQNFWLTAVKPVGNSDGSCFIAQSTATLKVVMGGAE